MPAPLPASVPDSQLGLSAAEIHLLRQHQQQALGPYAASHHGSTSSSRGRGQSRSSGSGSTSRAGSAGTSHGQGRLMLDAGSLAVLGAHFERLMVRIQERVDYLSAQTTLSTTAQSRSVRNTMAGADAEIARFKELLRQIDELEMEFDKVRHIRDIVKGFRARVESVGRSLDRRR